MPFSKTWHEAADIMTVSQSGHWGILPSEGRGEWSKGAYKVLPSFSNKNKASGIRAMVHMSNLPCGQEGEQ
ncbi:hypothetical protein [Paenibacillus sp. OSY-SE]|uniref:hypothetical protein n=1 Tax=Paenibacillus sp. OSY-SE TaxID=1196323 RepID=UPI000301FB24|nr:hypothetical protein [Paenibacillus sp. OSY-SE]